MIAHADVICCCCKKDVSIEEHPTKTPEALVGWVSIGRKAFCGDCVALFTDEDWEWCGQPLVPLELAEIARLLPGDVEPL